MIFAVESPLCLSLFQTIFLLDGLSEVLSFTTALFSKIVIRKIDYTFIKY